MIFLNQDLFNRKEKNWIGRMTLNYMNKHLDDDHQITTVLLYADRKLRDEWRKEIRNVYARIRADMENDPEFIAEQEEIEDNYHRELYELIERWKMKNMRRSVLEYTKEEP